MAIVAEARAAEAVVVAVLAVVKGVAVVAVVFKVLRHYFLRSSRYSNITPVSAPFLSAVNAFFPYPILVEDPFRLWSFLFCCKSMLTRSTIFF